MPTKAEQGIPRKSNSNYQEHDDENKGQALQKTS